jgi:hypothetical protein
MQVNQEWENRPARRQVKPKRGDIKTVSEEGGEYNIWYNRFVLRIPESNNRRLDTKER